MRVDNQKAAKSRFHVNARAKKPETGKIACALTEKSPGTAVYVSTRKAASPVIPSEAKESIDLYLSLGSNLGDREANIKAALTALNRSYGRYKRLSRIIETAPEGFDSPNAFLNCVVRYRVKRWSDDNWLDCCHILSRIKEIERRLGRDVPEQYDAVERDAAGRRVYHDRPIDIDILFYGDYRGGDSLVTVPHPRIAERGFVLRPLREIATQTLRKQFPEYF